MNRSPLILGILIGIAVGLTSGFFLFRGDSVQNARAEKSVLSPLESIKEVVVAPSPHETPVTHSPEKAIQENTLGGEVVKKKPVYTNSDQSLSAAQQEFDLRLEHLTRERTRAGSVVSQAQAQDGGIFSKEKMPDGSEVTRSYNNKGILTNETWGSEGGETIFRSFFESGQVKDMRWITDKGTIIMITEDSDGDYVSRIDDLPNGDKFTYEFDSNGRVTKKWFVKKGSKPVLVN